MHETSLVRSLLKQVGELLDAHLGESVETIRVEIGALAGIDRTLFELAFLDLVGESRCRGAVLLIHEVPISGTCLDCGRDIIIEGFRFVCPICHSTHIQITGGEDVRLLDVDISSPDPSSCESC